MIREAVVAQAKASRFGRPPLYRRMCSADGSSAPTTRFLSPTGKAFSRLPQVLGLSSITGAAYFVWQWQEQQRQKEEQQRQKEERERPFRTILDSKVVPPSTDSYIPRNELSDKLKVAVFSQEEDYKDFFISITGNHEVGKSQLIRHVLGGYSGVLEVSVDNDLPPRTAIRSILGVTDDSAVVRAFVEAKSQLGRKPIIIFDVHEQVTNPGVIKGLSNFAKDFGFEKKLVKVLVVCSTAGTAAGITGDGRRIDFFVPQLTREELDSADARRVFEIWHGKRVNDEDVQRIFDLVGGRIGSIKDILLFGKRGGHFDSLDKAIASIERKLLYDVRQYEALDLSGGFGPGQVRLASWLAHEVARFPFEQCVPDSHVPIRPADLAMAARDRQAHPIYFNPNTLSYCARSPFVHRQLRSVAFHSESRRHGKQAGNADLHPGNNRSVHS